MRVAGWDWRSAARSFCDMAVKSPPETNLGAGQSSRSPYPFGKTGRSSQLLLPPEPARQKVNSLDQGLPVFGDIRFIQMDRTLFRAVFNGQRIIEAIGTSRLAGSGW